MNIKRTIFSFTALLGLSLIVAACTSTSPFGPSNRVASAPVQLPGVASSSVQTSSLPPLQGQDGVVTQSDEIVDGAGFDANYSDPGLDGQGVNTDGSFVSINDIGSSQITPAGRDLSGTLTTAKLLGTWILSAEQGDSTVKCRLNLTQTTKAGTNRYRASAPNCEIPVVSLVSSWALTGSQVQLYDNNGAMVGAFQRSDTRFVGTLSGGIAASLDG